MSPTKKWMAKQKYRFSFWRITARIIKRAWYVEKYCVLCGKIIKRNDKNEKDNIKSNDVWNKEKKCLKCSEKPKDYFKGQDEKYCSLCGDKFHEFDESKKMKDWNSWNLCSPCKKIKSSIVSQIQRSCLELADRAYKEFLQEKFYIKKSKRSKKLSKRFRKIIPEVIDSLEDFFREATSITDADFDRKYKRIRIFFWRTVEEELFDLFSSLNETNEKNKI